MSSQTPEQSGQNGPTTPRTLAGAGASNARVHVVRWGFVAVALGLSVGVGALADGYLSLVSEGHRADRVRCQAGNDFRRLDKARWDWIIAAETAGPARGTPDEQARQRQILDAFQVYNAKVDALVDCAHHPQQTGEPVTGLPPVPPPLPPLPATTTTTAGTAGYTARSGVPRRATGPLLEPAAPPPSTTTTSTTRPPGTTTTAPCATPTVPGVGVCPGRSVRGQRQALLPRPG